MKAEFDSNRLEILISALLDETLSGPDKAEFNQILLSSPEARIQYRRSIQIHSALIRHPSVLTVDSPVEFRKASSPTRHSVFGFWAAGLAACISLGGWMVYRSVLENESASMPVARLSGASAAKWGGDEDLSSGDLKTILGVPMDLVSGFAEVTFRSGVRVVFEGPCRFKVTSVDSVSVDHGRASVVVPHRVHGFHLDTPGGRITDLGTEFGVAVGSGSNGPVVLTEVFKGEIEIPAENNSRKRLLEGDSLAIVRNDDGRGTRLVSQLDDYKIDLGDSARRLPSDVSRQSSGMNLALGKPVTSPAYYHKEHGSIFPGTTVTDGRLNDTGSPGDWSFWLAPNGEDGEFTVDLQDQLVVSRVDLQNTRNRTHGDRGMRDFALWVSNDNREFKQVLRGELQRITEAPEPGIDFPFQTFEFAPISCRYVKLIGLSHYRLPDRPLEDPNHGGGINEIRVFGP